jgi:hypothetical protein
MSETVFEPTGIMSHQIFGLAVDRKTLFSNHKNVYKKRIEKRQRKLIIKLSFLKTFLKQGEQILQITSGYSPLGTVAQYVTGFVFVYLKRSLFVFTNLRILHIPTTPGYQYKGSIAQIAYAGCRSIALKGGTLVVEYGKFGNVETFKSFSVAERKKIRDLLKKVPFSGTKSNLAARSHLCPRCAHQLTRGKYACANCQLKFKSKLAARIISIIFPGGGYFYSRHYLIGFLNAIWELFLISYFVYIAYFLNQALNGTRESMVYLVLIGVVILIIKIISVIHSNYFIDEFIPKDRQLKRAVSGGKEQDK